MTQWTAKVDRAGKRLLKELTDVALERLGSISYDQRIRPSSARRP
jgi:hypothetical protein